MRITALVLTILIGVNGAFVQSVAASPEGKRVAYLTASTKNPFIAALANSLEKRATELGMKITVFGSPFDPALQARQMDDAIAQKYDMIALTAVSENAILPSLKRAKDAGIPVILSNTPGKKGNEELWVSWVGENHYELGRVTGEAVVKALNMNGRKGGKVALVTGALMEGVAPHRVAGFKEVVSKDPNIEIVAIEDAHWSTSQSEKIAGQLFARFASKGGLDAIYGMADNQAGAIVQAAEDAGIKLGTGKDELVVVGSNCMKVGIDHIKSGKMYSTGTQLPTVTGRRTAELMADFFNGKTIPKEVVLPAVLITKENISDYEAPCSY